MGLLGTFLVFQIRDQRTIRLNTTSKSIFDRRVRLSLNVLFKNGYIHFYFRGGKYFRNCCFPEFGGFWTLIFLDIGSQCTWRLSKFIHRIMIGEIGFIKHGEEGIRILKKFHIVKLIRMEWNFIEKEAKRTKNFIKKFHYRV